MLLLESSFALLLMLAEDGVWIWVEETNPAPCTFFCLDSADKLPEHELLLFKLSFALLLVLAEDGLWAWIEETNPAPCSFFCWGTSYK